MSQNQDQNLRNKRIIQIDKNSTTIEEKSNYISIELLKMVRAAQVISPKINLDLSFRIRTKLFK